MSNSIGSPSVVASFRDSPIGAFTQEILVLALFMVSFMLWRRVRGPSSRKHSKLVEVVGSSSPVRKGSGLEGAPGLRQRIPSIGAAHAHGVSDPLVRAAEQQMLKHLEQREFTRALNAYRTYERDGRDRFFKEELFSAFIQSAIRVGKIDVVERMLRAMKRNRVMPSLTFWQTTLKMLSSRKHFSACLSVYSLFTKQIPADKVLFSCLINAALEIGAPERASAMLEKYGESGIDAKDYVLFFRTYVATGDVVSAETTFRKLGDEVTAIMLNLMLLTCVNAKQPKRALELLEETHDLEKRKTEKIVDVVSYNTLIKGFSQASMPSECFDALHKMLEHNLEPDDITLGTLLDACIMGNDIGAANEIVGLLMGNDRPMDTVICTLFIKGLVRGNCLPKALELYDEMNRREGARPSIVTYSVLIKALVDQHDLERALRLVEDMRSQGHKPDDIIVTHLLEGCRHSSNHALGKKLFDDMLSSGVKPSEFTLVTMLKLHGRCGAHKEAHDLVENWEGQYGLKPSVIHYTCLMSGCLRTKSYDQAWSAYEMMIKSGVRSDETAISTLLPGMVAAQQWDHALLLVKQSMQGPRINIPAETLNNALSQMLAGVGAGRQAEQLQAIMRDAGVVFTARNQRRLAPAHSQKA